MTRTDDIATDAAVGPVDAPAEDTARPAIAEPPDTDGPDTTS